MRGMGHVGEGEGDAWLQANTDRLGGPMTYESYPAGFSWAMNTPLRWTKQFASMLGGIRNGMILSWPGHVAKPGSICPQFGHLIDIAPTVLDAAQLPAPKMVAGVAQKPIDGQSLLPSLLACEAAHPRTQYFEIGGKVGLYHNGWFLSGDDGRPSWQNLPPSGTRPKMEWTLYNLTRDFSQSTDVAAKEPAQLQTMLTLWKQQAERNNVFPLDHRFGPGRADREMMRGSGRKHFDFWGKDVSLPALSEPILFGRSFTVVADLQLTKPDASGVVVAMGSHFGGWSLFLDKGHPSFIFARSTNPAEIAQVRATQPLPQGTSQLKMRFTALGAGKGAEVVLSSGAVELARVPLPSAVLMPSGGGETLDVGRDLGVPVTNYHTPRGAIEGDIPHVTVDFD